MHETKNDYTGWTGLYHYYHFSAENLLGGLTALASIPMKIGLTRTSLLADRVIVPWEGPWQDKYGMNEMVVKGMYDDRELDATDSRESYALQSWDSFS